MSAALSMSHIDVHTAVNLRPYLHTYFRNKLHRFPVWTARQVHRRVQQLDQFMQDTPLAPFIDVEEIGGLIYVLVNDSTAAIQLPYSDMFLVIRKHLLELPED